VTAESTPYAGTIRRPTGLVLLAAGAGTRFGDRGHKLLANLPASADEPVQSVIERSLARAVAARIAPLVVVSGALSDAALRAAAARVGGGGDDDRIEVVHNPQWADGQMSSVRVGLAAAAARGCTRVVIGLGDQPGIAPTAWRLVADDAGPISVATYDGRRGNPVALDDDVWPLLPDGGDEGARTLMRVRPDLVREVPCTGSPRDIDTEEDLRRWQSS